MGSFRTPEDLNGWYFITALIANLTVIWCLKRPHDTCNTIIFTRALSSGFRTWPSPTPFLISYFLALLEGVSFFILWRSLVNQKLIAIASVILYNLRAFQRYITCLYPSALFLKRSCMLVDALAFKFPAEMTWRDGPFEGWSLTWSALYLLLPDVIMGLQGCMATSLMVDESVFTKSVQKPIN